jgi:hypothetical protein
VADAREPLNKAPWNDVEQGFFAGAPPDSPQKTPPPLRFDDLEPIPTPRVERRMRQRRAADLAVTERAELRPVLVRVGARCVPVLKRARVRLAHVSDPAWRTSRAAIRTAAQLAGRGARRIAARISAAIPTGSPDRWAVASLAALFLLVGVSAVVAATRGGAPALPPAKTLSANVRANANANVALAHATPRPAPAPAAVAEPAPAAEPPPAGSASPATASRPTTPRPAVATVKRHRPHHRRVAIATGRVAIATAGKAPSGKAAQRKQPPPSTTKKAIASTAAARPAPARVVAAPARSAPPAPARAPAVPRPMFSR